LAFGVIEGLLVVGQIPSDQLDEKIGRQAFELVAVCCPPFRTAKAIGSKTPGGSDSTNGFVKLREVGIGGDFVCRLRDDLGQKIHGDSPIFWRFSVGLTAQGRREGVSEPLNRFDADTQARAWSAASWNLKRTQNWRII
jgi:hypothetical protein